MSHWSGSLRLPEYPRRKGSWLTPLAIVLPLVICALVVWLVVIPSSRREAIERCQVDLKRRVDTRHSAIEEWLRAWKSNARVVAGYPTIRAAVYGEREAHLQDHLREIFVTFEKENGDCLVAIVDESANVVSGLELSSSPDSEFVDAVRETIASRRQVVRFITHERRAGLLITAPIVESESSERVRGSVVLIVDPSTWLYPFLAIRPTSFESAEALLVQQESELVRFVSPLRFRPGPPGSLRLPIATPDLEAAAALKGGALFARYVDYRHEPVFGASRKILDSRLGLVVKVDVDDVSERVRREATLNSLYVALPALLFVAATLALVGSQRRAARRDRTRQLERIAILLEQANDAIFGISVEGRILWANRRAVEMYGRSEQELLTLNIAALRPERERQTISADIERVRNEGSATYRAIHTRRDGTPFPVEISSRLHRSQRESGFVLVVRDVSEQIASEARIGQLTRMLRTLSRINELINRSTGRGELLRDACDAIVRGTGVPLVWIGTANPDGSVAIAAASGEKAEQLGGIELRWDDSPCGNGPSGLALREQVAVHIDAIEADDRTIPWRERASAAGFRAGLATPISPKGARDAVLTIYGGKRSFFDEEAQAIVREIAANLAHALETIADRDEKERARALLRAVVDGSPVPIYAIDTDRRVVSWNMACERVFGWSASEVIGQPLPIVPPDREAEAGELFAALLRGEPTSQKVVITQRRDGTPVELELSVAVLRSARGEITGAVAVALDITGARRTERKAKALFDADIVGTLECDVHGHVFAANDEFLRIIGYSREDLEAGTVRWDALTPPEWLPLDAERIAQAKIQGTCAPYEKEYIRKDGDRIPIAVGFQLLEPERERAMAIILDVSPLKHAERELRRINADLEQRVAERTRALELAIHELEAFSYSVSHDLRAPLRAIDGFSKILEEEHLHELDGEGRRLLGVVRQSTRGMGQLIDDLLSFSRVGRHQLKMSPVAMKELAETVWLDFPEAQRSGVELTLGDLPEALGDGALLRQVWQNLLSNALKYSAPKSSRSIEIGCTREGGRAVYYVRDNGVGFDMQHISRLFGVFERLHLARDFEGTGVGLALVRRIVERHGGAAWAEGEVGVGATFYFTLDGPRESGAN